MEKEADVDEYRDVDAETDREKKDEQDENNLHSITPEQVDNQELSIGQEQYQNSPSGGDEAQEENSQKGDGVPNTEPHTDHFVDVDDPITEKEATIEDRIEQNESIVEEQARSSSPDAPEEDQVDLNELSLKSHSSPSSVAHSPAPASPTPPPTSTSPVLCVSVPQSSSSPIQSPTAAVSRTPPSTITPRSVNEDILAAKIRFYEDQLKLQDETYENLRKSWQASTELLYNSLQDTEKKLIETQLRIVQLDEQNNRLTQQIHINEAKLRKVEKDKKNQTEIINKLEMELVKAKVEVAAHSDQISTLEDETTRLQEALQREKAKNAK